MRSQSTRLATSTFRSIYSNPHNLPPIRQPAYICSTCRAALQSTFTHPPPTRRNFTTTSIHQQSASSGPASPNPGPTDQLRTHYALFTKTFPSGPPPDSPFLPDLQTLRSEFFALQTKAHPDRFPAAERVAAEARSAALNDAYRTLADPLRHANYLLAQNGVDTEDESAKLEDPELLMEVMEVRERVDEAEAEEELAPLMEENRARIEESVSALEGYIRERRWEDAGREAVRLRYWRNIEESIRGWEKGAGGGVLHH